MVELLAVLMILGVVTWLAIGQVGRSSSVGQGSDTDDKSFTDARLAAARSGTPQIVDYGSGSGTTVPEGYLTRVVVFPDATFSRRPGMRGSADQADPPGVSRSVFHALEVR